MKRTKLCVKGTSDTSIVKREIQHVLREIAIRRDGGCIFRLSPSLVLSGAAPACNGFAYDSHLILQAGHLITRANAATNAEPRLIFCVCEGRHGRKKWHEREYNALVRTMLSPDRVRLWDDCERDSWKPHRGAAHNWPVTLAALKQALSEMI